MKDKRLSNVWVSCFMFLIMVASSISFFNVRAEDVVCSELSPAEGFVKRETYARFFDENMEEYATKYLLEFYVQGRLNTTLSHVVEDGKPYTILERDLPKHESKCWRVIEVTRNFEASDVYGLGSVLTYSRDFRNVLIRLVPFDEPDHIVEHRVDFMVGQDVFTSIMVRDGNVLNMPKETPPKPNYKLQFKGWFIDEELLIPFDSTEPIIGYLKLYAGFKNTFTVTFKDASGEVYDIREGEIGRGIDAPSQNPKSLVEGMDFQFWMNESDRSDAMVDFPLGVYKDITLIPYFSNETTVNFYSSNTLIDSQHVKVGESIQNFPTPQNEGYHFEGWGLKADASWENQEDFFDVTTPITSPIQLFAIWRPLIVSYRVDYYVEKLNFKGRPGTNLHNYQHTARVNIDESNSSVYAGTVIDGDQLRDYANQYFTDATNGTLGTHDVSSLNLDLLFSEFSFGASTIIQGDGSSIIQVYYTRIPLSVRFDLGSSFEAIEINGEVYHQSQSVYTLIAKYGQDISELFPGQSNVWNKDGNQFESWSVVGTQNAVGQDVKVLGSPSTFPYWLVPVNYETNRLITLKANVAVNSEQASRHVYVSVSEQHLKNVPISEVFELSQVEGLKVLAPHFIRHEGVTYEHVDKYDETFIVSNGLQSSSDALPVISGQTFHSSHIVNRVEMKRVSQFIFYTRDEVALHFDPMQGSLEPAEKVMAIPSGDTISQWLKDHEMDLPVPKHPKENHQFLGWYTTNNPNNALEFDPQSKMPTQKWTVFALYEPNVNSVEIYSSTLDGNYIDFQSIKHGEPVKEISKFKKGYYYDGLGQFIGWGVYAPDLIQYNFNEAVYKDLQIYGMWKNNDFRITYDLGDGLGTAPVDTNTYQFNDRVSLPQRLDIRNSKGDCLVGWVDTKSNEFYDPDIRYRIQYDTIFRAVYLPQNSDVSTVEYHENNDSEGQRLTYVLLVNDVLNRTFDKGYFEREGYVQIGWSTTSGGPVDIGLYEIIQLNDTIRKNDFGDIILYAVWEKIPTYSITFLIEKTGGGTFIKDEQSLDTIRFDEIKIGQKFKDIVTEYPKVQADEDYVFSHWSFDQVEAEPMYVQQNLVVYAHFVQTKTLDLSLVTLTPSTKTYSEQDPTYQVEWPFDAPQEHFDFITNREAGETVRETPYEVTVSIRPKPRYERFYTMVNAVAPSTLSILPLNVSVSPQDNAKTYGMDDPEILSAVSVDFEVLEHAMADFKKPEVVFTVERDTGENAGDYEINVHPISDPNYTFTTHKAIFRIHKQTTSLVLEAPNLSKIYGNLDPTQTELIKGVTGKNLSLRDTFETLKLSVSREPGEGANVYKTTVNFDPIVYENYASVEVVDGALTIDKRNITLHVDNLPQGDTVLYQDSILPPLRARLDQNTPLAFNDEALNYEVYLVDYEGSFDKMTYDISCRFDPEDLVNRNYNIKVVKGTLTLREKPVVPSPPESSKDREVGPEKVKPPVPNVPETGEETNQSSSEKTPDSKSYETTKEPDVQKDAISPPVNKEAVIEHGNKGAVVEQGNKGEVVEPGKKEEVVEPSKKENTVPVDRTSDLNFTQNTTWSLVNLAVALCTFISACLLALGLIKQTKSKGELSDEDSPTMYWTHVRNWQILSVLGGLSAGILFIITQDMVGKMVLSDRWTPYMVALLGIQGVCGLIGYLKKKRAHDLNNEK